MVISGCWHIFIFAQVLITHSLRHGKASTLAPISYTTVLWAGILGWLIWDQIPDLLSIVGMVLVIAGGVYTVYMENRIQHNTSAQNQ